MPVLALDHVNIRTPDVSGTAGFLRDLLGLRAATAPGAASIDQGCWMYDTGERPIIHIGPIDAAYPSDEAVPFTTARGSGAVHHVALECAGYDAMVAKLDQLAAPYSCNDITQIGLRQVFVSEANGILLELNFREPPC